MLTNANVSQVPCEAIVKTTSDGRGVSSKGHSGTVPMNNQTLSFLNTDGFAQEQLCDLSRVVIAYHSQHLEIMFLLISNTLY